MLFLLSQLTFFLTIEHKTEIRYIYTLGNLHTRKPLLLIPIASVSYHQPSKIKLVEKAF